MGTESLHSGVERISYWLLRSLAHKCASATEEQLDAAAAAGPDENLEPALRKAQKLIARFGHRLPIDPRLSYLDVGCGGGAMAITLVQLGLRKVTGVDMRRRNVERAVRRAERCAVADRIEFVCADVHSWTPPQRYDVLLSFDALEHIAQPKRFLESMQTLVSPHGRALLAFGPLFHSPFGDHMHAFFRFPIPWRGVLFPESVILRLRREFSRPDDPATRYEEIAGGLNLMRYSEFLKWVDETGWQFEWLAVNSFLQRFPPLQRLSDTLMRAPVLRDYLAHNVYCVLRSKPA